MASTTETAFPYTGIPSTEVTREPGHSGMAEHGTEITKHLLQEANDRVEAMTDESHHVNQKTEREIPSKTLRLQRLGRATTQTAESVRARTRAHPLTAVLCGVAVGVALARVTRR